MYTVKRFCCLSVTDQDFIKEIVACVQSSTANYMSLGPPLENVSIVKLVPSRSGTDLLKHRSFKFVSKGLRY